MRRCGHLRLRLVLILGLLVCPFASAQSVSEKEVKAAYVYNFARFVEWPAKAFENSTAPFRFCVWKDASFESALSEIVKNKSIAGRPLQVIGADSEPQARRCHVLFINSSQYGEVRHIMEELRQNSVLTVGDSEGFLPQGGIIDFILENKRIHFEVNHRAANEAGLRVSARLLGVAKVIIE